MRWTLLTLKALTMCVCVRGMRALDVTHVESTDDGRGESLEQVPVGGVPGAAGVEHHAQVHHLAATCGRDNTRVTVRV